jgi:hypothetical protein
MNTRPSVTRGLVLSFILLAGCGNLTEHGVPERVAFAPDGSLVVSLIGATQFFDGDAHAITRSVTTPVGTGAVYTPISRGHALSADGSRFAVAAPGTVTVYAAASGSRVASFTIDDGNQGRPTFVTAITLDGAGARLAVVTAPIQLSTAPGHLRVFDVGAQSQLLDIPHDPARAANAAWSGGVALSSDGSILYGAETLLATDTAPAACFLDAWSIPDGARLWDVPVPLAPSPIHTPSFILSLSSDDTLLAGGSWDTSAIYVWHTSDGSTATTFSDATTGLSLGIPDAFQDIRFSPDAGQLLVAFPGGPVLFGADATYLRTFVPDTNIGGGVVSAAFSPDGNRVASVFISSLELWNLDGAVLSLRDLKGQLD